MTKLTDIYYWKFINGVGLCNLSMFGAYDFSTLFLLFPSSHRKDSNSAESNSAGDGSPWWENPTCFLLWVQEYFAEYLFPISKIFHIVCSCRVPILYFHWLIFPQRTIAFLTYQYILSYIVEYSTLYPWSLPLFFLFFTVVACIVSSTWNMLTMLILPHESCFKSFHFILLSINCQK